MIDRSLSRVWTALPVHVLTDSDGHTVDLQPTIKGVQTNLQDGTQQAVPMPTLGMAPVCFAQGGGFVITHPVKQGDEGIAIFSARNIDSWFDKGSVQNLAYQRRHNLSDAMYLPGIRSQPRKLGGQSGQQQLTNGQQQSRPPSTTSVQIRTEEGQYYYELTPTDANSIAKNHQHTAEDNYNVNSQNTNLTASQQTTLDTPDTHAKGTVHTDKDITSAADVFAKGGISLLTHTHGLGGGGESGPPQLPGGGGGGGPPGGGGGTGGIEDCPNDGRIYGREYGIWIALVTETIDGGTF
jgi:hypothetical protein